MEFTSTNNPWIWITKCLPRHEVTPVHWLIPINAHNIIESNSVKRVVTNIIKVPKSTNLQPTQNRL